MNTYGEATAKLVYQFETRPETLELIAQETGSMSEAMASITAIVASGFIKREDAPSVGHEARELSTWHAEVEQECSSYYQQLRENSPHIDREDANADQHLVMLNAIRRGVGQAMRRSYKAAEGQNEQRSAWKYAEPQPLDTTRSLAVKEKLQNTQEFYQKRRIKDRILAAAGATVMAVSGVTLDGDTRTGALYLGGAMTAYAGVRRLFAKLTLSDLDKGVKRIEKREQLATMLPILAPPNGLEYALEAMALRHKEIELKLKANGDRYADDAMTLHSREMDLHDLLRSFPYYMTYEGKLCDVIGGLLYEYDLMRKGKNRVDGYFARKFEFKTSILDEFLPIDQEADRTTPVDPATGQKTWAQYIQTLADRRTRLDRKLIEGNRHAIDLIAA